MKRILIILILSLFLFTTSINAITLEQKELLQDTLNTVGNNKQNFIKLLDLLNKNKVDLSNEDELAEKIKQVAVRFEINLRNYNIRGLQPQLKEDITEQSSSNLIWIIPTIIAFATLLIYELFKINQLGVTKVKKEYTDEMIKELNNYIKNALKKGYTKEEIKRLLLANNWKEYVIDESLKNF